MNHSPSVLLPALAISLIAGLAQKTGADEGGVPFWFSGQYASFATIPATPGWSIPVQGYHYSGSVSGSKQLPRGSVVTAGDQALGRTTCLRAWLRLGQQWHGCGSRNLRLHNRIEPQRLGDRFHRSLPDHQSRLEQRQRQLNDLCHRRHTDRRL